MSASRSSRRRSASITGRIPGRRTLSTTAVPSASRARCNLGQGPRRQRHRVELGEHRLRRLAQVLGELGRAARRRDAGAASRSLPNSAIHSGGKEVAAGRQDLPQLDEGRPQLLERAAHPGGGSAGPGLSPAPVGPCGPLQCARHPDPLDQATNRSAPAPRRSDAQAAQGHGRRRGLPASIGPPDGSPGHVRVGERRSSRIGHVRVSFQSSMRVAGHARTSAPAVEKVADAHGDTTTT